ncbi:hypothetical protein N6H18_14035 [Reichenbachiella agarivorans]|uniref:NigD-like protein n=1 Tax=Reichenbachiella agarivorans TaxID=2979464 RepID=A0ABY6CQ38_9BACT|nr:hypothetical protein [Reichenbachiella agarivorans]UXP31468.1 hypothetical protein N6H18_14035 [Reichenbachiella agarivorans]
MKSKYFFLCTILTGVLLISGCNYDKADEILDPPNSIIYKLDGRTVKYGDPFPIAIDLSEDGQVDFTIFVELTANSQGDRLYVGMNPIGANLIKSGPPIDENFLSMGLLVAEIQGATIDLNVGQNKQWTPDFGALVIRNTSSNGQVSYEGNWADSEQIVGIQNKINQKIYFGWLRIKFDKTTEIVTLIDYAYDSVENQHILGGAKSN